MTDGKELVERDAMLAAVFGWSVAELDAMSDASKERIARDIAEQRAMYEQLGFAMDDGATQPAPIIDAPPPRLGPTDGATAPGGPQQPGGLRTRPLPP